MEGFFFLGSLDDALKSLDAYDVVFELQRNLVWPPLTDVDKTTEIPPVQISKLPEFLHVLY